MTPFRTTIGERIAEPVWLDARRLVHVRARLAGNNDADVYVVDTSTGRRHAVTSAYPNGGANRGPTVVQGSLPPLREAAGSAVPPQAVATTSGAGPIAAGDTLIAAFTVPPGDGCPRVGVWKTLTAAPRYFTASCTGAQGRSIALAGSRVAWHWEWWDRNEHADCLRVEWSDRPESPRRAGAGFARCNDEPVVLELAGYYPQWDEMGHVDGGGSLLVFDRWQQCENERGSRRCRRPGRSGHELWRLDGRRPRRIASSSTQLELLAVGEDTIVVRKARGRIALLDASGRLQRLYRLQGRILDAAVDGENLVVLRDEALEVVGRSSGRLMRRLALSRGFAAPPRLEAVGRGYAALVVGAAIDVVRLFDGRRLRLRIPGVAPPVRAALLPTALVYSYNVAYKRQPGRLAAIPLASLDRRLR